MNHFQCFECGMISDDQGLISNHMRISHNIKVEVDLLSRNFPCSLCKFTTRDMDELKNHLISVHNKEKYNWMVEEIEEEYHCDECEIKFSRKSELQNHLNNVHNGDRGFNVDTSNLEEVKEEQTDEEAEIQKDQEDLDFSIEEQTSLMTVDYKEKEWPTGYTFKSKSKSFAGQMNPLIKTLKIRKVQEINGVKFRTLNSEYVGGATEIEMEVIDNMYTETSDPEEKTQKVKSNAKIKIWALNPKNPKKKECTVMVDKIKDHNKLFVKIIAQKVVKPTIDSLLKGEGTANLLKTPHEKTIGKITAEEYKCEMCHMIFGKEHGLRVHKGKMHSENKRKHMEEELVICDICKYVGVSKEDMLRHKTVVHSEPNFKCEKCSYAGVSVEEVQNHLLIMHSDTGINKAVSKTEVAQCVVLRKDKTKCMLCDYNTMDESELKRHIRDDHRGSKSPTTSPPKKKYRQESYFLVEEIIQSLTQSLNLEDKMEEDEEDELPKGDNVQIEDELAERSRLQDKKVIAKQKKIDENEKLLLEQQNKARNKDLQDKKRKRPEKKKDTVKDSFKKTDNHRIPEKYRKMFIIKGWNIDDYRLMETGGGGKCGAYCGSLHISSSTDLATEIRQNINYHIVDNWMEFENSFQYPCVLQVGSGNREFKNDKELRAFLLVDQETHACMQAFSNMQNMTINILTKGVPRASAVCIRCPPNTTLESVPELIKHEEIMHKRFETEEQKEGRLLNARWTTLKPSCRFTEQEKIAKTPDMFVMHEDDVHYSLMVHKNHEMFSRLNKDQDRSPDKLEVENSERKEASNVESVDTTDPKKEVARLKSKVKVMELEQTKTLEEMRTMRTKLDKLISENKTLQEFKDLSKGKTYHCDRCDFTTISVNEIKSHINREHPQEEIVFKCDTCGFSTNSEANFKKYAENHKELGIKCRKCGEVLTTEEALKEHLKSAHPRKTITENSIDEHIHCNTPRCSDEEFQTVSQNKNSKEGKFVCRSCKEKFEAKWQLMNHRRDNHPTDKMCFYDAEDKCSFSASQCWYKHKENRRSTTSETRSSNQQIKELKCFTCQNKFANVPSLMEHRKQNHIETVKPCSKYVDGKCDRGQKCWYLHETLEESLVDFHVTQKTTNQP